MPHCCVPQCRNRSESSPQLSFYRFPANSETRRKWMLMIQRDDFVPTPNTRVCSWHFPNGKDKGPSRFHWTENKDNVDDKVKEPVKKKYSRKQGTVLKSQSKVDTPLDMLASAASFMEALGPSVTLKTVSKPANQKKAVKRNRSDTNRDNMHAYAKKMVVSDESSCESSTDITIWHAV